MAHRNHQSWLRAVAVALWVLAGCKVATEGAPCQSDASCPRGQRCGVDLRCSAKAAKCTECADGETKCVGNGLATCKVAPDGVCRVFGDAVKVTNMTCDDSSGTAEYVCATTDCKAEGVACPGGGSWIKCAFDDETGCLYSTPLSQCMGDLVCGPTAESCVCPAAGDIFYVDPVAGSDDDAATQPTGAVSPPTCRFKKLGSAVAAANERVTSSSSGATATVMVSATGGNPFTFSETSIELEPGVTLTSDAAVSQDGPPPVSDSGDMRYILEVSGTPGVMLHEGATLSGLELRPADGASVTDGIATSCSGGGVAVVQDAKVAMVKTTDRTTRFGNGVHQASGCTLTIERTSLEGNGVGVLGEGEALTVDACAVSGGQTGILLQPSTGSTTTATINGTSVKAAADTGIQLRMMGGSTVTLTGNTITGNCATTKYPWNQANSVIYERAGGILFFGDLPKTTFSSNTVAGNGWNQVLVVNSSSSLDLSGSSACGDTSNQFCANPGAGQTGVGVFSTGASVTAWHDVWKNAPPGGADYGGNVSAFPTQTEYCVRSVTCSPVQCPPQ